MDDPVGVVHRKLRSRDVKSVQNSPEKRFSNSTTRQRQVSTNNSAILEYETVVPNKTRQKVTRPVIANKTKTGPNKRKHKEEENEEDEGKANNDGNKTEQNKETSQHNTKRSKRQGNSQETEVKEQEIPILYKKRTGKKVDFCDTHSSSDSSKNSDDDDDGNSDVTESGMASSFSSQSTDEESDSPVPTSELSDSSKSMDSNSCESSGSEVPVMQKRKSPRKHAQAKSRKKIAELCADESSDSASVSSYSED